MLLLLWWLLLAKSLPRVLLLLLEHDSGGGEALGLGSGLLLRPQLRLPGDGARLLHAPSWLVLLVLLRRLLGAPAARLLLLLLGVAPGSRCLPLLPLLHILRLLALLPGARRLPLLLRELLLPLLLHLLPPQLQGQLLHARAHVRPALVVVLEAEPLLGAVQPEQRIGSPAVAPVGKLEHVGLPHKGLVHLEGQGAPS
jgi:hypothetical protein